MRKHAAMLLAPALSLALAACGAQTTSAQTQVATEDATIEQAEASSFDEEAYRAFIHEAFQANQIDTILSNHESVTYRLSSPLYPSDPVLWWEASDCLYAEQGPAMATYFRDDVMYDRDFDSEAKTLDCTCGIATSTHRDNYYSYVQEDEAEFVDEEHESFVEGHEADGTVTLVTHIDEEGTEKWYAGFLPQDQAHGTLRYEAVYDATTHEVLHSIYTNEEDGQVIYEIKVAYDEPEPAASLNLRAPFERESENMMECTFVFDPGTDNERTRTLTVPTNTEVSVFSEEPAAMFDDVEATTVTHWDRMGDKTLYIFTHPSDELMATYERLLATLSEDDA